MGSWTSHDDSGVRRDVEAAVFEDEDGRFVDLDGEVGLRGRAKGVENDGWVFAVTVLSTIIERKGRN